MRARHGGPGAMERCGGGRGGAEGRRGAPGIAASGGGEAKGAAQGAKESPLGKHLFESCNKPAPDASIFLRRRATWQELFKVAIRSFGKPLKRFEVCAISLFLAMNREANENMDDLRHSPISYFEQFLGNLGGQSAQLGRMPGCPPYTTAPLIHEFSIMQIELRF